MPTLSPDALAVLRVGWVGDDAEREVLAAFRGAHPADFVATWADRLAEQVAGAFLSSQVEAVAVAAENLTDLAGSTVTPDPVPLVGRVGQSELGAFLDITPAGFLSRISGGMTPMESLVTTANFLASSASTEVHAVAREATLNTAASDGRFQGWARQAEPGACDFCRMLASRGAVYESKDTASKRRDGLRYHKHCHCTVHALPRGEGAVQWAGKGAGEKSDPRGYRAGAQTPERARFVAHQIEVMRKVTANGGTAWDRGKLAELEAELTSLQVSGGGETMGALRPLWRSVASPSALTEAFPDEPSLRRLLDDGDVWTDGRDIVHVATPGKWRLERAVAAAQATADEISAQERKIAARVAELRDVYGVPARDVANLSKGRKVGGFADSAIVDARHRVSQLQEMVSDQLAEVDSATRVFERQRSQSQHVGTVTHAFADVMGKIGEDRRHSHYVVSLVNMSDMGLPDTAMGLAPVRGMPAVMVDLDSVARGVAEGDSGFMPSASRVGLLRYTLAHEVGHTRDFTRDAPELGGLFDAWSGKGSRYASESAPEMYAEAYAEWVLGDRAHPMVAAFADRFGWGAAQ